MLKFLLLALRNITRNRRRTLMTMLMVAGGVTGLLLVGGFFAYMYHGLQESTINEGLGHLQIYNAEHFKRDEVKLLDTGIDNWQLVAANVGKIDHVRGVAPRIAFLGLVSNGTKSAMFMGNAVDPQSEQALGFHSTLASGHELMPHSQGDAEAVIGVDLAKSMNVKIGDGLTLLTTTADGAINGIDVTVVGLTRTGMSEIDSRALRIALPDAQRLVRSDRISNLVVGLDQTANTDAVYAALTPRLAHTAQPLTLKKWIDLATSYKQIKGLFNTIFIFIGIIVFFMVLMSNVNTLLMTLFERTREVGTMLAMGTPRSWIIALFMLEASALGLLGALFGLALGSGLTVLIDAAHVHLPPPPGSTEMMEFHVRFVPGLMIGSSVLVIVALVLASILPAVRAARLQIAEALSHV